MALDTIDNPRFRHAFTAGRMAARPKTVKPMRNSKRNAIYALVE
jgi:hypothetical protein